MTVLRSETRTALRWCLKQPGWFSTNEMIQNTGCSQPAGAATLRKFEDLMVAERRKDLGRLHLWRISDRETAEKYAHETPKDPRSADYVKAHRQRKSVFSGANSVFNLAA